MKGNREGQEPWTEDDLFDLDSALACGGDINDVADFLSRDVAEVERKAYERNLPEPAEKRRPGVEDEGKQRPVACLLKVRRRCLCRRW
jgi:hypothetical protein